MNPHDEDNEDELRKEKRDLSLIMCVILAIVLLAILASEKVIL